MTKPDATLALIAARFTRHDVEKSGKGYQILDRRTANPIARLRPIPNTDRFELFYWSNAKGRWTTFGPLGRMKLMLESAHEIVDRGRHLRSSPPAISGMPPNPRLPYYAEQQPDGRGYVANPAGSSFIDLGVGGFLTKGHPLSQTLERGCALAPACRR